jgi:hypothetical protein
MKLTNQQIEIIDQTLVLNGVVYDDVKLELIDHIATDIENQLENQESDFEVALKKSFENWSDQLQLANSFWVNTKKAVPRMLLDKWILDAKKKLIKGSVIAIVLAVLITIIEKILDNEILIINARTILQAIFSIELVAILVLKFFIWKSDKKSFSGFLFQTQTRFSVLFMILLFCLKGMPLLSLNPDLKINLASNFMAMFYMVLPLFFLQLAFKHFQFIQKFKIS